MRTVVAIKEMACGNEVVGEMWQETKIFKESDSIEQILNWAFDACRHSRKRVTITIPHEDEKEDGGEKYEN
jgi:hypothetical protein